MKERGTNIIKGTILLLFAGFLAEKYFSGKIYNYISPRFGWMAVLAMVIFIMMAIAYLRSTPEPYEDNPDQALEHLHEHNFSIWPLAIICGALLLGFLVPSSPLGANQVTNQGISTDISAPNVDLQSSLTIVPAERNILDWVRAIGANPDAAALNGQTADVIGFVYRDVRFTGDQFMVARFAVSCCVADARAMGLVVDTPDASQYTTGAWVQVTGVFNEGVLGNNSIPTIQAEKIKPVEQPFQPYLYP